MDGIEMGINSFPNFLKLMIEQITRILSKKN